MYKKCNSDISGFPGIGKTLSVNRALSDLEKDKEVAKNI